MAHPPAGRSPLTLRVRLARAEETPDLVALMRRAVLEGTGEHYGARERAAWAAALPGPADLSARLEGQEALVAEAQTGGTPLGLMTLTADGALDLAYVDPDAMGRGVAAALHDRVLTLAAARGIVRLETEASHLARRFFQRAGWELVAAQRVERGGIWLTNFRMEKRLAPGRR